MPTNKKKKGVSKGKKSVEDLISAADQALMTQDASYAIKLYTAALELGESTSKVYEKRADAKLSVSDQVGALEDYTAALSTIDTDELERKADLYLYIGQLCGEKDALDAYQKGIDCLTKGIADEEIQNKLVQAYCNVAELYLTDLCFEENAEQECESYIGLALTKWTDEDGEPMVDALQTAANVRLSQKRGTEALALVLRAFEKMRAGCEALASLVGLRETSNADEEEASELLELDSVQNLPGFEFRCQTAKLLLECNAIQQQTDNLCVNAAIDVLGSLLAENDDVIEIWFLTGDAFAAMNPPNHEIASHYWERTKEMLTATQQSLEQQIAEADDDEEEDEMQQQLDEVTCQLEDVVTKLEQVVNDEETMEEE
jgi:tetratricopeptide (TPR) repeat protein